jgi:glycosyltransferase involved in cell wall biosynthesis
VDERTRGVPLVMPAPRTLRAAAVWITTRSWALAAEQRTGHGQVVTPEATWEADELGPLIDGMLTTPPSQPRRRPQAAITLRTFAKDVLLASRHIRGSRRSDVSGSPEPVFVWQHHDPFLTLGNRMARSAEVPLVQFVDAPHVWEARRWGVRRPVWGRPYERLGEVPQLRAADVIVCVSEDVAAAVDALTGGVPECIVAPCTADASFFSTSTDRDGVRTRLGFLPSDLVVGWSGSFRRFHALDHLIDAFGSLAAGRPDLHLLLVGDGPDRARLEERAAGIAGSERVSFTGQVPYSKMRDHVAAMDIATLTAPDGDAFHYSPLKLREYRAAGRAVVAPAAGQVVDAISDGADGLLYEPGDVSALADHIEVLANDGGLRRRFGEAARDGEVARGGAAAQVDVVLDYLRRAH